MQHKHSKSQQVKTRQRLWQTFIVASQATKPRHQGQIRRDVVTISVTFPRLVTITLAGLPYRYEETPPVERRTRFQMIPRLFVAWGSAPIL